MAGDKHHWLQKMREIGFSDKKGEIGSFSKSKGFYSTNKDNNGAERHFYANNGKGHTRLDNIITEEITHLKMFP